MEVTAKIHGLEDAMKAMRESFPSDRAKQRSILNTAMRKSAVETIVAEVKHRAKINHPGSSGALSESIGVRAKSLRRIKTSRSVAGVEIGSIRYNDKAMAMYVNHYYIRKGKAPPKGIFLSGIRHAHLVEFGTYRTNPKSFLWDGAKPQLSPFMARLAADMKRTIERRVNRMSRRKDFSNRRQGRVI